MNVRFLYVLILLFASNVRVNGQEWKMVWHDEFNKKGTIDSKKWSTIPRGPSDWNNYMSDDSRLYDVRKGNLILRGMVNDDRSSDTATYITGGIYSRGKFALKYGKVEVRAKLPNAGGCWPAIWMLPDVVDRVWPDDGEIDIMEHLNHDSIVYQTVHSFYTQVLKIKQHPSHSFVAPMDNQGYNIYGVEKTADKLIFYVNGVITGEYPRISTDKKGQYPYDTPFYFLIDMQLGGSWVGKIKDDELPVEMYVDWIRVYALKDEI